MEHIQLFEEFLDEGNNYSERMQARNNFLEFFRIPEQDWAKKFGKYKFDGTDDVKAIYKDLGRYATGLPGVEQYYKIAVKDLKEAVNEGKKDYVARFDGVDINLKNGYKYLKDHELEALYTSIGKALKGKTTMAKKVEVVFESLNEAKDLTSLQRTLDKLQNEYDGVLDDEALDAMSDFIQTINSKIKNK